MKHRHLTLLLAGALLSGHGAARAADGKAALQLRERATVSAELVRIADVAELPAGADPRLGGLVIGAAPDPGAAQVYPRREIYEKLVGNGFTATRLEGAAAVRVERNGRSLETSFFQPAIAAYVARHSRWGDGLTVTVLPGRPLPVPGGDLEWIVQPANGGDFFGNVLFRVAARSGDREVFNGWVTARLKIEAPVAVSNRALGPGEAIADADVRWERREITPFTRNAVLAPAELAGRRAARLIRPNTVLTAELLQGDWLVRRGQTATLAVDHHGVRATTTVRVLADGRLGDRVRAQNESSRQLLTARVTGSGALEVEVP